MNFRIEVDQSLLFFSSRKGKLEKYNYTKSDFFLSPLIHIIIKQFRLEASVMGILKEIIKELSLRWRILNTEEFVLVSIVRKLLSTPGLGH